ncbi:MAG: hypothetical protein ACRD0J_14630, partial [Acidimicrobiales bacterium]
SPSPQAGGGLSVAGPGVVLSSLRRRGDWLELRVVAEHPEPTTAVVGPGLARARRADLLGRPGDPLPVEGGSLSLPLAPFEIATVQLQREPGRPR